MRGLINTIIVLIFLTSNISFGQDKPKFKEVEEYELFLKNDSFVGTYIGEVDRVEISGKKRRGPQGYGYFVGKNGEGIYLVGRGQWQNGALNGKGSIQFCKNASYPNAVLDSLRGSYNYTSSPDSFEDYLGDFVNNELTGSGVIHRASDRSHYEGQLTNWLPNGTGSIAYLEDTIYLGGIAFYHSIFVGQFVNGEMTTGKMMFDKIPSTFVNQSLAKGTQILTGDWSNKRYTGFGKVQLTDEKWYEGNWVNGDMDGQGRLKNKEGEYTGQFKNNVFHGKGTMKYTSGWIYEANYENGFVNGALKRTSPTGLTSDGILRDRMYRANGQIGFTDGAVYEGPFVQESSTWKTMEGQGKITYPNGDVLTAYWKDNSIYESGRRTIGLTDEGDSLYFEGNFINGLLNGNGKKLFMHTPFAEDDGQCIAFYEGNFKAGEFTGKGKLSYNFGRTEGEIEAEWEYGNTIRGKVTTTTGFDQYFEQTIYEGPLTGMGIPNGQGTMTDSDGFTYEGNFQNGFLNGQGKITYPDGKVYQGDVVDNRPNGKGTMTLKNKTVLSGIFVDGEYQKPFECKSATIGNQVWMAENLNVSKFRNGDPIPEAKTVEEWVKAANNQQPAWCYYDNDPANGAKYGKLYNWYAVHDPRGLAPLGWHIPTDTEWGMLKGYLGDQASEKMKSKTGWRDFSGGCYGYDGNNGTNSSGFNAYPGGERSFSNFIYPQSFGYFHNIGIFGTWWSSDMSNGWRVGCGRSNNYLFALRFYDYHHRGDGLSIRCVKD